MEEKILEVLHEMGFKTEQIEDFGYGFNYEGKNYFYISNNEDEDFLCLTIPGIYDIGEENTTEAYELTEKINSTLKYVKAYQQGKTLWLFYERELFGGEDLPQLLSRMIIHLESAFLFVGRTFFPNGESEEEHDDENPNEFEE